MLDEKTVTDLTDWLLGPPLKIVLIVIASMILNRVARRAVKRSLTRLHTGAVRERMGAMRRRTPAALLETGETSLRAEQRIDALSSVLRSVVTFVIWLVAALMCLGEVGIDLAPLLAGAGVLGVAIGFGSQSLVRDFLSGAFILIEDQFGVGDTVDLGDATGVVEAVSLRTTRLRAVDGTVWHMPNGEISRVGNMSQHWSRALLDVEVAYDTDLEHARSVIKTVADRLWREDSSVLDEPEMWGVEQLGAHGVVLRLVVKTTPSAQWGVSRELRERIKAAFDEEGIEIPFPQQTVCPLGAASSRLTLASCPAGRIRGGGPRARRRRPAAPGRPHPQDPRHRARRRLAAHLRHRVPDRRRRAVDRLDVGRAQGARPAPRPALRAPQRLRRPARTGTATRSSPAIVEEITDPERVREINGAAAANGPSHLFRLDLREVSTVGLDDTRTLLVIDVWTPERGVRTIKRS